MEEEKKNKDDTAQEPQTITPLLHKEDQNQLRVAIDAKTSPSLSNGNAPLSNQQYPLVFQWPNPCEHTNEQPSLVPRPCIPAQSPSPVVLRSHPLQNPAPQGQMPLHLPQPTTPFWLTQRPGLQFGGDAVQPLTPMGANDAYWQAPAVMGGASSLNQAQAPNVCYHVGYPYAGFPGPWDPSMWWNQAQQLQPPYAYNFPRAYGHFSSPALQMPGGTPSTGQSFQRGIIQPPAKLSQKHHQLWEAQSAENVQLWAMIGQLQSELADYKGRLTKLEGEVSSLKPTMEEHTGQVSGTVVAGQAPKRGRPRRTVALVSGLPSLKDSQPIARGRKPSISKVHSQTKELIFEKVVLNKVETKEKTGHSTTTTQQQNNEKIRSVDPNISGNMAMNGSNLMPVFQTQANQEIQGGQECGYAGFNSSEMRSNGNKVEDFKGPFSVLSQQARVTVTKSASATYIDAINNGTLGWPSNMNSQHFYNNGSVIKQGEKVIPGWNFVNEEGASDELEDVVGSGKDENEEMGDNEGFGAEDIDKEEGAYSMDAQTLRSPGLPDQFGNWPNS